MRLNLGCGFRKRESYINVDLGDFCTPDVICDLTSNTWPWEDSTVEEANFEFSLEQMGESRKELMHVLSELYRVMKHEGKVKIVSAHPRHDQFLNNPMNTHRLSIEFFKFLSVQSNLAQIGQGNSDNCLGLEYGVNFEVVNFKSLLSFDIHELMISGKISEEQVRHRMRFENNICQALEIDLLVVKK